MIDLMYHIALNLIMRSYLTRNVFRRILAQKGYIGHHPHGCIRKPSPQTKFSSRICQYQGCRTIFGFSSRNIKETRDVDLAPGLETMMELQAMQRLHGRPPIIESLVKAWQDFFTYKKRTESPVRDFQAQQALTTLEYLQAKKSVGRIPADLLDLAIRSLAIPTDDGLYAHRAIANLIFEELVRRREGNASVLNIVNSKLLDPYITILCRSGGSMEALQLAKDSWMHCTTKPGQRLWRLCLEGLSLENREQDLLKTIQYMEQEDVPFDSRMHKTMTTFYSRRNDIEMTKQWYSHSIAEDEDPLDSTNREVIEFSLRNNELEWCGAVFQKKLENRPSKRAWDGLILWAAANKSPVESIDRIISEMSEDGGDNPNITLNIHTINAIVELASSMDDPVTAERYVGLGQKRNIPLNAKTYLLQIQYRLQARDLEGALVAYRAFQSEDSLQSTDMPALNRLLRVLCQSKEIDFDTISGVVTDLEERPAGLEPDTIAALCKLYLERHEHNEALNILFTYSFHFSLAERTRILSVFTDYILDRKNSIDRVWEAFTIVTQVFTDIGIDIRTAIMQEFFQRDRSDMGLYIFRQIKESEAERTRPTIDTYVKCLKGLAHTSDAKGLDSISNMLKLDVDIDPNTKLYNALMLAFTACEEPRKSMEFWDEIIQSPEGPDQSSIQLAFQACEKLPLGLKKARKIWSLLDDYQVDATREVFATYVGALAGQRQIQEAQQLIEQRHQDGGTEPDAFL